MAKIYVAYSWRNVYYPEVVTKLREYGQEVYDFRNPPHNHGAFMWKDIDPEFDKWNIGQYRYAKLQELHTQLFRTCFEGAHDAFYDILATYKCFWELRARGWANEDFTAING